MAAAALVLAALGLALAAPPWTLGQAGESDAGPAPPAPAQAAAAGNPDNGAKVFASASCGACHTLAAAGAAGQIGPPFDGDSNLTNALVVDRVTNGQGAMPPFSGQLSEQEISDVAAYVMKAAAK